MRGAWRRLDRRMLLIHPIQEIPRALPALLAAFVAGNGGGRGLIWIAVALVITLGLALSRWFTTRYRVTEDRVEVGSGLFRRRVRAVSRDRIRTVDVTARAMHRLLGLARVEIGTGRSDREEGGGVRLDGLTATDAVALRARAAAPRPPGGAGADAAAAPGAPTPAAAEEPETELARLDSELGPLRALHALGRRLRRRGARLPAQRRQRGALRSRELGPGAPPGRPPRPRAGRAHRAGPAAARARGGRGGLDRRLRARLLGLPPHPPSGRDPARHPRAHHHPRDHDRGAPAARRRGQRAAAAAHGGGRAPDRHRHRPARRPRSRARRIAARAAGPARRGPARGRRGHRQPRSR